MKCAANALFYQNGGVASSSRSGSTVAGSILAVCDQNGTDHDDEMRRKYIVLSKTAELRERQGVVSTLPRAY